MIKACIFDLDGVVVDTARYHYLAWNRLAKELGFEFTESDNERLKGVSRMASLDILLSVGGMEERFTEEEKNELAAKKNGWYVDFITNMTSDEILPGVSEFLNELKANGYKIALGSASRNAPLILRQVEITHFFEAIVDGNSVSEAKPSPEVFLIGAELLGVSPSECLVFEDAVAGVEAAHRGEMKCIGVGDPVILQSADAVISGFEGFTINRMNQLLNL